MNMKLAIYHSSNFEFRVTGAAFSAKRMIGELCDLLVDAPMADPIRRQELPYPSQQIHTVLDLLPPGGARLLF
jgi:hypothetical protein